MISLVQHFLESALVAIYDISLILAGMIPGKFLWFPETSWVLCRLLVYRLKVLEFL